MKLHLINKLLIFFSSLIVTLIIGEICARVTYPFYKNYQSEFWRYGRDLKIRSADEDIGHEHIPSKSGVYYGANILINHEGFRVNAAYSASERENGNKKKILVIGDSLALGWGINFKKTYCYKLEHFFKQKGLNLQVLDAGVGNYGIRNKYGLLKKLLSEIKPDLVIFEFHINDIEIINYPSWFHLFLMNNSYLYSQLRRQFLNFSKGQNYLEYFNMKYRSESFVEFKNYLDKILELHAKYKKIPIVFFNIPELHQLDPYPFDSINKKIKNLLPSDVYYLDALPSLKTYSPNLLWLDSEDIHPNEKGHDLLFSVLVDFINKNNLIRN